MRRSSTARILTLASASTSHGASDGASHNTSHGRIQISVRGVNEATVSVRAVRAGGLRSSMPLANSFVTVGMIPVPDGAAVMNPQTNTIVCCNDPLYNEVLNLDITKRGSRSRLFVAVWNKLPDRRPAELIGAMSFSLRKCLTEPFIGWFQLLDEQPAMSKHMSAEPPEGSSHIPEERLYENTNESHYKQPRLFPHSTARAVSNVKSTVSRRSSSRSRRPPPRSQPPPIPAASVSSGGSGHTKHSSKSAGVVDPPTESVYKQPSKSLYKRPVHTRDGARPVLQSSKENIRSVRHASQDNIYASVKELARFDKPIFHSGSSQTDSTCSSSQASSSLDKRSSAQNSTHTMDKRSSRAESTRYQDTMLAGGPDIYTHSALGRVLRQSNLPSTLMMSPDTSQSSSDSQALWSRLNSGGVQYTPVMVNLVRGPEGFGFTISDGSPVSVYTVEENSTADKAGLKRADKIIEVDGENLINASVNQVVPIIRHQQRLRILVWRVVTMKTARRRAKTDHKSTLTPTKRSAGKVTGSVVARKKHKPQQWYGREKKNRNKREGVPDGMSIHSQSLTRRSDKALDMVTYLHDEESEFCDVMMRSYRYHANELQQSGKLSEADTFTLFQNVDMLIDMSQYFSSKLEIVVRHATDGKRVIATAPEIYVPRVEVIKQHYLKYLEGLRNAEVLKMTLKLERGVQTPKRKDVLSLEEFIHNPLHHIQKVSAAFTVLLQQIENSDVNLSHVQKICTELQLCCEQIEASTRGNESCHFALVKPPTAQHDKEMVKLQERLVFPPKMESFDLCQPNRHQLYCSDMKVPGIKQKMLAYLFSDMVLIVRPQGGRERKLLVCMDPVRLCDVIDVEYGPGGNDCALTVHYMLPANQRLGELPMVCSNIETKLVWKGLLRCRLTRNRVADLSLSDQGIQVSESSECADGDDSCCDALPDLSHPKVRSSDGLTDSMTAIADDLCPSNQLRNNSSNGGETPERLQLADYTKHEAKQALTVSVNNNNNLPQGSAQGHRVTSPVHESPPNGLSSPDASSRQDKTSYPMMRTPPIDLSAITEEGDDVTNTSMHLSCSHEATPTECASTPLNPSQSTHSDSYSRLTEPSTCTDTPTSSSKVTGSHQELSNSDGLPLPAAPEASPPRTVSSPEICASGNASSQSMSMLGYGEEMCTPLSGQRTTDSSLITTETSESNSSKPKSLSAQQSLSVDQLADLSFESQRCELPCQPARASFMIGDSPPSSTPVSPLTPVSTDFTHSTSMASSGLPHVESEAKLATKSPAQRKTQKASIKRSQSYSTAATPNHAGFLQQQQMSQQLNQLTFEQEVKNTGKPDGRQRKFSAVAKNVRTVLSFFRKRPSEANAAVPPLEVVESWSQNFSNLLNDKCGLMLFKSFLLSEYSEENIEFWIACEEYKQLKSRQYFNKAQKIYADFITVHAPKEVNLDSKTRVDTMTQLEAPDKMTFSLAQSKIQCLMEKDSYTRFLKSTAYTNVLTQARAAATASSTE